MCYIQRIHMLFINTSRMARDVLELGAEHKYEVMLLVENITQIAKREGLSRSLIDMAWITADSLTGAKTPEKFSPHPVQEGLMRAGTGLICTDMNGRPWVADNKARGQ